MNSVEQIEAIFKKARHPENYVPRNYATMGGMWTVDTWMLGDTKVQLADEGCTIIVQTDTLRVYTTYGREAVFSQGTPTALDALYGEIFSAA